MVYRAKPSDGLAWITGASSGIGRAAAQELVRRGYRVAVTARRAEALASLAASTPGHIFVFQGDVTDRAAMAALVAEIEASLGPIALAFLNAGVYFPAERDGFSAEVIAETFEINVGGVVNTLAPVLEAMRKRQSGQIAITSSIAGYGGIPGSLAYGGTKAALINMAEALRITVDDDGVAVQVVNPGFVQTEMNAHNDFFEMPFLMTADEAAKRICDGFETGGFEITFPRRLAWFAKALCLLPYPLYLPVVKYVTRRAQKK
ncbi:SDR family NAD(P)-dependent oxidoreductase [Methyloferula stellata]|uniref:SDR family NAD(P)-dependent oxidoreductase n=1 Tax=Methyloferula stellata TaxID=876270 RepID=UPI0003697C65|nr:SDR family NAD(P)-dependent oxidoreductase [Methyloferula stellata]